MLPRGRGNCQKKLLNPKKSSEKVDWEGEN
jgi:hypothetical protein